MPADADTVGRAAEFAALSVSDREALALCLRARRYAAGEVLFREGDPGQSLFLVGEGSLVAVARAGGPPREVGRYQRGGVVAASALVERAARSSTVSAVGPAVAYELDAEGLELLREIAPGAARAVMGAGIRGLLGRLRRLEQRVEQELERAGSA